MKCSAFLLAPAKLSTAVAPTDHNLHLASYGIYTLKDLCGVETRSNPVLLQEGENIQDLTVVAVIADIDGAGGFVALSGPCNFSPGFELPLIGSMYFDPEDLDEIIENDKLNDLVLPEMMHTLILGTIWDPFPDNDGNYVTSIDVLEDEVYDINSTRYIVGRYGDNQPKYVGEAGFRAYQELTGNEQNFFLFKVRDLMGKKFLMNRKMKV
eukprot:maker-scaffold_2-snap-gene-23.6-mRNA-1 protein AED:0.00 eAED:0.00 QI:543/1/1/1/1/1/2/429/209